MVKRRIRALSQTRSNYRANKTKKARSRTQKTTAHGRSRNRLGHGKLSADCPENQDEPTPGGDRPHGRGAEQVGGKGMREGVCALLPCPTKHCCWSRSEGHAATQSAPSGTKGTTVKYVRGYQRT